MLPPLLKAAALQPGLLVEHAAAYAELAGAEAAALGEQWRRRALLGAGALLLAALALGFGGVALMLAAALPISQMPMPSLLWLVPGVPAVLALLCGLLLMQQPPSPPFALLRGQLAQDLSALSASPGTRP